jgi:hypothetical protein
LLRLRTWYGLLLRWPRTLFATLEAPFLSPLVSAFEPFQATLLPAHLTRGRSGLARGRLHARSARWLLRRAGRLGRLHLRRSRLLLLWRLLLLLLALLLQPPTRLLLRAQCTARSAAGRLRQLRSVHRIDGPCGSIDRTRCHTRYDEAGEHARTASALHSLRSPEPPDRVILQRIGR